MRPSEALWATVLSFVLPLTMTLCAYRWAPTWLFCLTMVVLWFIALCAEWARLVATNMAAKALLDESNRGRRQWRDRDG